MKLEVSIRYIYIFACLCTLLSGTVFGQQSVIKGKIQLDSGEPGIHVTVQVKGTNISGMSDHDGQYSLNNVPYGNREIQVTAVEIQPKTVRLKVDKPTHNFPITVLAKGDISIESVEVDGRTVKRDIETSGFAVNVVETKEASLRNLQTNELLDRTVGVRIRQNGGIGADVQYNLNGMSGRSVGIFIDGIEISTYGSSFNLNNIPPAMIERIEVYKGVLPAHLTGDLMGGAINVVMKKGVDQNNITASVSYGSFNTFQTDVSGVYRNSKSGLTVRASGFYTTTDNNYEIWGKFARNTLPDGTMEQVRAKRFWDGYRSYAGRFEIGYTDVKWADQFLIGYNVSDTYNEIQHGQTMTRPYMGRFSEANAHILSLNYNKKNLFVDGLSLNVNGTYSMRETYIQDTVSWEYNWSGEKMIGFHGRPIKTRLGAQQGEPTMNTIDRKIATVRSNLMYNVADGHRISFNHVFYTVDRFDADELRVVVDRQYRSDSDLLKNVFAWNYEAETFNKKLRTNLFFKYYQQNIAQLEPGREMVNGESVFVRNEIKSNKNTPGYGLAVSYSITPKVVLISSAERAVRMPSENEIFGSADENTLPNIAIRPEISNNYNLGFRLGSFNYDKHRLSLSSNTFLRRVKDRIMRQANTGRTDEEVELSPFINIGRAESIGFEGELGYIYNNNLNVMVNFSKFRSLYKEKYDPITGNELERYNQQLPNEPFFTINGNAQYRIDNVIQKSSILNVFYNAGFVAPFYMQWIETDNGRTPRQLVHDIGLSYGFPNRKIVASLDVKNVFDAEVYDNFAVQKPGRGVYFKINYTINNF